jgi:peptide/nickel transport system substrate-binding protein
MVGRSNSARLGIALVTALGLVAGLVFASGSGAARRAAVPTLRVGVAYRVESLDPSHASSNALDLEPLVLEPLIEIDSHGKLRPWLASSWSRLNPVTFVFHLRHGVRFTDGKELTSADVVASLNYFRKTGTATGPYIASVQSVTASGPSTVVVKLKHPDASFEYNLASSGTIGGIFEKAFWQAHAAKFGEPGTLLVGTGPWTVDSLDPTSGAELSANPHYWGGQVAIQHISVKFFADETSEALAYRSGALDVVPRVIQPQSFVSSAKTKLLSVPSCQNGVLGINVTIAPFNDIHVRRAIAYAINRADVIKAAAAGFAEPDYTLIPRSQLLTVGSPAQVDAALKTVPVQTFSLAKAKQELAQSAVPGGFTFEFDAPSFANWPVISEAISGDLSKIGIKAKVKIMDLGAWYAKYNAGAKVPPLYLGSVCTTPDPSFFPAQYLTGSKGVATPGANISNYAPVAFTNLLAQGLSTYAPAKRLAIYTKVLRQLGTDLPVVPLFVQDYTGALTSKFTWPTYGPFTYFSAPWALGIRAR